MRTLNNIRSELIADLDVTQGITFLIGIRVKHIYLGEGTIVKVRNRWDLCTVKFEKHDRWMEFFIDEFADPKCGWDFDLEKLDEIFGPHMVKSNQSKKKSKGV